jgi:hypothetical protein
MILRILFLSIFIVHGLLHLLGFLKAYRLAEVPTLQVSINRAMGAMWLLALLLFVFAIALNTVYHSSWWIPALLAVLLSQILIISAWSDAKWGTLANIFLLIAILPAGAKWQFDRMVKAELASLWETAESAPTTIDSTQLATLPPPVLHWMERSGALDQSIPTSVWLEQNLQMKLTPDQPSWTPAQAVQLLLARPFGFIWKVDLKMNGLLPVSGRDRFQNGRGYMLIKLLSLFPVAEASGPKIDEGALQRYLSETIWMPTALLHPSVSWQPIDSLSAKATLSVDGTTGSGVFHFNEQGDMVRFTAQRFRGNEPDAQRMPWIIEVQEWSTPDGVRIPSKCTVTWELEEGDWTWLQLEVVDLKYNPVPPLKRF